METLEIIRRMAVRHGDDQIASVLNRLGYSTGKNKRWNQIRVATARRNYSIAGQKHALPDPETVSLNEAARICGVSHRTIERLVEAGLLKREQVTARAPWRIRRTDLNDEPFEVSSKDSCAQASWFCKGVVFDSRCGAHRRSRSPRRDA
jgi:excisionase family DNA binding protein